MYRSSIPCPHIPLSNASRAPSRPPSHGLGPGWFAKPYPYDFCHHCFMPVYPDAIPPSLRCPPGRPYRCTYGCRAAGVLSKYSISLRTEWVTSIAWPVLLRPSCSCLRCYHAMMGLTLRRQSALGIRPVLPHLRAWCGKSEEDRKLKTSTH